MSSYRSSYKSSSYRYSSEGTGSSRARGSRDQDDESSSSHLTSRRTTYNFDDGDDSDLTTSPSTSRRLTSRFSSSVDEDDTSTSRSRYSATSKYKSYLSKDDDDSTTSGSLALRSYGRYSSRDDEDTSPLPPSSRLNRYSSFETAGDDSSYSTSVGRRQGRYSYYSEEGSGDAITSKSYSRRYTTDLDTDNLRVSALDDEITTTRPGAYSLGTESSRRHQESKAFARLDSKDAGQVYEAILDYKPPRSATDEICLKEGQEVIVLSKDKPHKWRVRTRKGKNNLAIEEGFAPSAYLKATSETVPIETIAESRPAAAAEAGKDEQTIQKDLRKKKDMIVRELLETEEDLIRDMQFVQRTYIRQSESSITPKEIKAVKADIFGCYKDVFAFHQDVLLKNFNNVSKEPTKLGTVFLKLANSFSDHTKYFANLPKALEILEENSDVAEFFNNYATKIRDEKTLSEHLKMPLQRFTDYQLLLKELSKLLSRMDENVDDLEKAAKFIATIPTQESEEKAEEDDLQAKPVVGLDETRETLKSESATNLQESSEKLGKMLKNVLQAKDFFDVIDVDGKKNERFIFLFKTRLFVTEINKNISESQRTYDVKKIIKLNEIEASIDRDDPKAIIINSKDFANKNFPIELKAKNVEQAYAWLDLINNAPRIDDDDKSEQNLLNREDSIFNVPPSIDENNNKINKNETTELPKPEPTQTINIEKEPETSIAKNEPVKKKKSEKAEKLKITEPLKSVTKHVGESVTLECKVSPADCNVKWLKNNKIFNQPNGKTEKNDDCFSLSITNLNLDDAGMFTFVASDTKESVSSSSTLNVLTASGDSRPTSPGGSVLPHAPKFKVKLKNTELLEGTTVRFEVVVRGLPVPELTFFKDSKPLKETDRLKILFQSKEVFEIFIEHVRPEDAGHYKCVAINSEGQDETSMDLKVTDTKNVFWGLDENAPQNEIGTPRCASPNFKWYKDGKEFEASERFQVQFDDQEDTIALIFQHVKPGDAGLYTCVASTGTEKISCSAELSVQGVVKGVQPIAQEAQKAKPTFAKRLEAMQVFEGETVRFCVESTAIAKAEFYHEDILIKKDNKRMHVKEEGDNAFSLTIDDAKPEDKGKYKCKLSNKYGEDEDEAELIIKFQDKAPTFKEKLQDIEAKQNDEGVALGVKFDGRPKPSIRWWHNGKEIKESDQNYKIASDDNGSTIVVPKMSYEHHGLYECQIENAKGMAKTSANLIVNGPPYIVKHLEDVAGSLEETVKLTAIIKGNPTPEAKWFCGNETVKLDNRHKYGYDEANAEFTLVIQQLQPSDLGNYRIEASNVYGKCESSAKIETCTKPIFIKELKDTAVEKMKANVEMVVQLDKQNCDVLVKWFKDNKEIKDTDKHYKKIFDKLDNSYKLVVLKATEEMVGQYKCQVANKFGSSDSIAQFNIKTKPTFVKGLKDTECLEGESVSMTVQVKGFPKPEVAFYKDGRDVSAEATIVVKQEVDDIYVLEIENIRIIMSGEYECRIRNEAGEASSKGVVIVKSKPTIIKDLQDLSVQVGEDVSLEVTITGKPMPEVKWFKNGKELAGNQRIVFDAQDEVFKIKMPNAQLEDSGVYGCSAENAAGKTKSKDCNVKVVQEDRAPKFVSHIQDAIVVIDDNVRFEAQIQASPAPEVLWSRNGKPLKPSDRVIIKKEDNKDVLILKGLKIDDSGTIACEAKNAKGSEKESANLEVHEPTTPTLEGLKDVALVHDEPYKIEAIVTGYPKPIVTFYKDGQPVDEQLVSSEPKNNRYALCFEPFTWDMAGKYSCSAVNSAGEAVQSFAIDLRGQKPVFSKELEETIVMSVDKAGGSGRLKLGQSAIFEIVVEGTPTPKVTWLKYDTPLKASHRVLITNQDNEHKLEIKEITKNDVAKYSCKAVNAFGEANSVCLLKFLNEPHAPIVKKELEDTQIEEGQELKLVSKLDGEPMPAVKWYKNGDQVDYGDGRIKVTSREDGTSMLVIEKSLLADSGVYEVKAENIKGATSSKCKVLIEKATEPLKDQIVKEDNNALVLLNATVSDVPTPKRETAEGVVSKIDDKNKIKFLKQLQPIEGESGKSVVFECRIDGNPADFDISWYKDDDKIVPNEHYGLEKKPDGTLSLIVDSFAAIDAGQYMVKVNSKTGAQGSSAAEAKLKAGEQKPTKPTFVGQLEPCIVDEKSPLVLKCQVASTSPITSKWYLGDKLLQASEDVKFLNLPDGTVMLQIDHAKKEDVGKYRVEVSNPSGKASSEAVVKVNPKDHKEPKMLKELQASQLIADKPGFIELQVDSLDDGNVKFFKDNKPIVPDDRIHIQQLPDGTIRLAFDNVLLSDAGDYTAIVQNNCGQVQSKANVTVKSKPIFTKGLADFSVKDGCSAKFEIQVEGNPKPELTWMRNGFDLEVDTRHIKLHQSDDQTYYLLLDKCNFRDEAEYSVKASNEFGDATSMCKLSIIRGIDQEERAPKFLKEFGDINFKPGDAIKLTAQLDSSKMPEFIWKKDGKVIKMSDRVMSNFDGKNVELTILDAGLGDAGQYELTVKNALGQVTSSAKASAFKEGPPKFTKQLKDGEENVKIPIKLVCGLQSYPDSKIEWFCNGKPIETGIKFGIYQENGEHILTIDAPNEFDSGLYECVATNKFGSDKTSATIRFTDKDKKGEQAVFITKFCDFDVLAGGTACFTACVVGNPKPELRWFLNDNPLNLSDSRVSVSHQDNGMIKLQIENVVQSDLGKYRCEASNIYGVDNTMGQLNFEIVDGLDRNKETHKSKKSQMRAREIDSLEFKAGGVPDALGDKPTILKMTDDGLTLFWMPSIPEQPRFPVSYVVEFAKTGHDNWIVYQGDIKDTRCDVLGLEPFKDYSFRVKIQNKFGLSDPSPFVTAFRSNLRDQHEPKKYQPEDYNIEHIPREKIAAAPKFLREEESSMYGVCRQPVTFEFWVYGYPEPSVTWYFNDTKIEQNAKFSFLQDRNGKVCLFLNRMDATDVGEYTCVVKNEHGEERRTIKLMLAEAPVFTKTLEETRVASRGHLKMECFVKGMPEPTLKFFKDFQPLHDTSRVKVVWNSPDHATLTISDLITRDQGLYSCTATNLVGSTTTAAFVHVDESAINYDKYPFSYKGAVKAKNKQIEQFYDLGDELGRGTQGITYHGVERSSGKSYAVKMMHGMGEMKHFMNAELEVMNQLGMHEKLVTLRDAFAATPHSLSLVTDMCGGGTLLDLILKKNSLTENEVADYIRQILEGLHYMHYKNIAHFGLTVGDILLDRMNGSDIRICDFGLAQRVIPGINTFIEFGHPEFVAPEIVAKNPASNTADVWSTGIIAHILLLGTSPFLGQNDRETLHNIQNKRLDLSDTALACISEQGRDFMRKVLDFDCKARIDVKSALNHAWLKSHRERETKLDVMDRIREYKRKYDGWYANASCKRYYRRRALHSCYTHPSRMIYPPDEQYSPMVSPDREINKYKKTISPFENIYPMNQAGETEFFASDSHYQCGPDTYLLQLRDTAFPTRIRRYLRIAATNSASVASNLKQAHWGGNLSSHMSGHIPQVSIKERRKFTDIMDEEITDEIRGESSRSRPMRLVREVGSSSYAHGQVNSIRREMKSAAQQAETIIDNLSKPIFREKLKHSSFKVDEDHVFSCFAIGEPRPSYTWMKNDQVLIESSRIEVKRLEDGRCELRIRPTREYDVGIYKCVASNSQGSVVCRARLCIGDVPGSVHPPGVQAISTTSALVFWSLPRHQFNTPVLGYKLEYKQVDENEWHVAEDNIRAEYHQINNLVPNTSYHFRLSASNKYGRSAPTAPSSEARTLESASSSHLTLSPWLCDPLCECDHNVAANTYANEIEPVPLIKSDFKELYDFKSIIFKGKFAVICQAYVKDGSRSRLACKCVLVQSEKESSIVNEYEIMKSLAHEKIASLRYANKDSTLFTLAMSMHCGLNVLTYLSRRSHYTEECVCKIVTQVLDAIEYLNYRNIALLELQPDNVLVVDDRTLDIKITDFANARLISNGSGKVSIAANPEYIAPEIIKEEEVSLPYTDVWCVGVLVYILLSGHSPYRGNDAKETAQNVVFVRYLFDRIYPEVTQEAIRFLLTVFKLTPRKRPNIEECLDNKWLICNDFMMKKRENATFSTARIAQFTEEFFKDKSTENSRLVDLMGLK